jgi:hypothetical protein
MKHILNLVVCLAILLPDLIIQSASAAAAPRTTFNVARDCRNGSCVQGLMDLADAKVLRARREGCMPPSGTRNEAAWYEENPITIECLKLNKEIEETYDKLQRVQAHYSDAVESDEEQMCRAQEHNATVDVQNLRAIERASAAATCSAAKQREVLQRCGGDAVCALVSSAVPFLGPLANQLLPANARSASCSARQDNCLVQMGTAFVKSVFGFFEGAWGLLKAGWNAAARAVGRGARRLWSWVTGAERQSSTAQLAAVRASREDGVFQQLRRDFKGTMGRLWAGLIGALNHWLANDIFCQEWAGTPRFSECKRPANGLACTSCKTVINGMCAISGVIIGEVIPSFLTGGLATAAKHGVSAAARLARLVRVSTASRRAVAASRVARMVRPVTTVTRQLARMTVQSRLGRGVLSTLKTLTRNIGRYLARPAAVAAKRSLTVMRTTARNAKTYIMMSPAGPVVLFGTKAARTAGKVIIFPFENAMTAKAFDLGQEFVERLFQQAGKGRLFNASRSVAMGADASRAMSAIDEAYIEMKVSSVVKPSSDVATNAQQRYLQTVRTQRPRVVDNYIDGKPTVSLQNLVDELYPELNYGSLTRGMSAEDIRKAESELMEAIGRVRNTPNRDRLMAEYQSHLSSTARADAVAGSPTFTRPEVISNATIPTDDARFNQAMRVTNIQDEALAPADAARMRDAVVRAHNTGDGAVYDYTFSEVREKYRILNQEGGFTPRQSDILIRSGVAGRARPEDTLNALRLVVVPKASPQLVEAMASNTNYASIIRSVEASRRPATARALLVLENAGMNSSEAAATFTRFQDRFAQMRRLSTKNSDAEALLAEIIRRERARGLSDNAINQKLDNAFGKCN